MAQPAHGAGKDFTGVGESIASSQQDPSTTGSPKRAGGASETGATSGTTAPWDHADQRAVPGGHRFAVFLSHNSLDKPTVERLAEKLHEAGLAPWLDSWYLMGGGVWQEELAAGLRASDTCAVFVGPNGFGDWAREELGVAQDRAARDRTFRLIPVLLPRLPDPFDPSTMLPPFLITRMWVDLRAGIEDPAGFQRLVSAITGVPPGPLGSAVTQDQTPPYRGLQPFEEEQAAFFFGRDADVQRLLEKLKGSRFLAVLGPSGSGKSSLVRAGLVPAVRLGELTGSSSWPIRLLKPGARPLETLADWLAELSGSDDQLGATRQYRAHLQEDPQALHLAIRVAMRGTVDGARTVLVVDQFEEVFTLCHDEVERSQFLANLVYAATVPDGACFVILTLRADFYQRCAAYPELAGQVTAQQYLVSPMSVENLRQVVEEPARRVGLDFQPGLVDAILQDVAEQPGALPLLEHALWELWQRRKGRMLTLEVYRDTGGVAGALAKRADEIYAQLTPDEQTTARRVLLRLTEPGEGTEDTRRRAALDELWSRSEEAPAVEEVLRVLTDARLLTTSGDERTGEQTVEVAHEALIRGWPRLRAWIDDDRAGLRTLHLLRLATQDWKRVNQDVGFLYRGARLAEAIEWRARNESALSALEREFLNASVAMEVRERRGARRRVQRTIVGLAAALAIVGILAFFAVYQGQEADRQRDRAVGQQKLATSRQLGAQAVNSLAERPDLALLLASQAYRTQATTEARGSLLTTLEGTYPIIAFLGGHTAPPWTVAFSPDGRTLASAGSDRTIRLWDVLNRRQSAQPLTGHTDVVLSVAFSRNGKLLASASGDHTVRLWDVEQAQPVGQPLPADLGLSSMAFSPDGSLLAFPARGTIQLWDVVNGQAQPLIVLAEPAVSVAFSLDGKTLASVSADKTIRLWNVETGKPERMPLTLETDKVEAAAFSPDAKIVATGSGSDIRVWDVASGRPLAEPLASRIGGGDGLAFSPDGTILASASTSEETIRLWEMSTGKSLGQAFTAHRRADYTITRQLFTAPYSVAFSPDGKTLASASGDARVRLWEVQPGPPLGERLTGEISYVAELAFSPDGKIMAGAGSTRNTVQLWDIVSRQPLGVLLAGHIDAVRPVAFSPDGVTVASAGNDGTIRLWNVASMRQVGQSLTGNGPLVFSPDGKILASGSSDHTVRLWDVSTHRPLGQPLIGHTGTVRSVTFSPDGKILASADASYTTTDSGPIRLWDVGRREPVAEPLHGELGRAQVVAFSPDGKILASGGFDKTIRLWDVATREPLGQPLTGHNDEILDIAFSPDGATLASVSSDGTIRLWEVTTGEAVGGPLVSGSRSVYSVAFRPDGMTLATGTHDGAMLWDLNVNSWLERACRIANRNMTQAEWTTVLGAEAPYQRTCPDLPPGDGAPADAQ